MTNALFYPIMICAMLYESYSYVLFKIFGFPRFNFEIQLFAAISQSSFAFGC